jgi:hypothetical protein
MKILKYMALATLAILSQPMVAMQQKPTTIKPIRELRGMPQMAQTSQTQSAMQVAPPKPPRKGAGQAASLTSTNLPEGRVSPEELGEKMRSQDETKSNFAAAPTTQTGRRVLRGMPQMVPTTPVAPQEPVAALAEIVAPESIEISSQDDARAYVVAKMREIRPEFENMNTQQILQHAKELIQGTAMVARRTSNPAAKLKKQLNLLAYARIAISTIRGDETMSANEIISNARDIFDMLVGALPSIAQFIITQRNALTEDTYNDILVNFNIDAPKALLSEEEEEEKHSLDITKLRETRLVTTPTEPTEETTPPTAEDLAQARQKEAMFWGTPAESVATTGQPAMSTTTTAPTSISDKFMMERSFDLEEFDLEKYPNERAQLEAINEAMETMANNLESNGATMTSAEKTTAELELIALATTSTDLAKAYHTDGVIDEADKFAQYGIANVNVSVIEALNDLPTDIESQDVADQSVKRMMDYIESKASEQNMSREQGSSSSSSSASAATTTTSPVIIELESAQAPTTSTAAAAPTKKYWPAPRYADYNLDSTYDAVNEYYKENKNKDVLPEPDPEHYKYTKWGVTVPGYLSLDYAGVLDYYENAMGIQK